MHPERILELLSKEYLAEKGDIPDKKDFLTFEISCLRGIGLFYANKLIRKGIKNLKLLSEIDIEKVANETDISLKNLEKWFLASIIIRKYSESETTSENIQRILISGIESVGKTCIIKTLQQMKTYYSSQPTRGAALEFFVFLGIDIDIWDLGGHVTYRKMYLEESAKYLANSFCLVYVFDVQKASKVDASIEYFEDIMKKLSYLKETPTIYILFNKYDQDFSSRTLDEVVSSIMSRMDPLIEKYNIRGIQYFDSTIYDVLGLVNIFSRIFTDVSPVSKVLSNTLEYYSGIADGVYANFLIDINGFLITEWTSRLTEERRDEFFIEIMEIIMNIVHKGLEIKDEICQSRTDGAYLVFNPIRLGNKYYYLVSVNAKEERPSEKTLMKIKEIFTPWIKNFFAFIT